MKKTCLILLMFGLVLFGTFFFVQVASAWHVHYATNNAYFDCDGDDVPNAMGKLYEDAVINGWNNIWYENEVYTVGGFIYVWNGTFSESNKIIITNASKGGALFQQYLFRIFANGTVNLTDCDVRDTDTNKRLYLFYMFDSPGRPHLNLVNCHITMNYTHYNVANNYIMYSSGLDSTAAIVNVTNTVFNGPANGDYAYIQGCNMSLSRVVLNNVRLHSPIFRDSFQMLSYNDEYCVHGSTVTSATVRDSEFDGYEYNFYQSGATLADNFYIDVVCDFDKIRIASFDKNTGFFYQQNTLSVQVVSDVDGSPVAGAVVTVTNKTSDFMISMTTDVNGFASGIVNISIRNLYTIPERIFQTPCNITVEKDGFSTQYMYNLNETLAKKNNWTISLMPTPTVDVTENLVGCSGTFEYSWNSLLYKFFGWANYTGVGGDAVPFLMHNPNPANGTLDYNYLYANTGGVSTGADIVYENFTELTEENLGIGIQSEHQLVTDFASEPIFGIRKEAQSFVIGENGYDGDICIKNLTFNAKKSREDTTGLLYVTIHEELDKHPVSIGIINVSEFGIDYENYNVNMSPYILEKNAGYFLEFCFPSGNIKYKIYFGLSELNLYSGGIRWEYDYDIYGNLIWMEQVIDDLMFDIWGWSIGGNISLDNVVNLTFSSNSSGTWQDYGHQYAIQNTTYCVLNPNMSSPNTQYWWRVIAENSTGTILGNETWTFTTGYNYSLNIIEKLIRCFGTHDTVFNPLSGYTIFNNYSRIEAQGYIRVYGTEYSPGETGTIYAQVMNETGIPVNTSTVTVSVWDRMNKIVDAQAMTYIPGSYGCYLYNITVPNNIGVFLAEVRSSNPTAFGSGEFHVSEWSSAIPNINNTVADINSTVTGIDATVNDIYTMLSYVNATFNPLIESKIDDLYTLCLLMHGNVSDIHADWSYLYGYVWDIYNMSWYLNNTIWNGHVVSEIMDVLDYINNTRWNGYNASDIYFIADSIENIVLQMNTTMHSTMVPELVALSNLCMEVNNNLSNISVDVDFIYSSVWEIYNMSSYLNNTVWGGHVASEIVDVLNYINDTRWNGFNASDIYTISDSIENIVSYINATTVSLGEGFTVVLTDFGEINPRKAYMAQITVFDSDGTMMDADAVPRLTLYDSVGNTIVSDALMTWITTGQYGYSYTTAGGQPSGQWTTLTKTVVRGNTVRNIEYWELESNPPEVTISVIDNCVPTIAGEITITNEGTGPQEYIYYWWVTPRADGDYADADTVDSGSASKLIAALDTFTTIKELIVPTPGAYWFKVRVYWGTEWSAASAMFDAIICGGTGSGGVSPGMRYALRITTVDQDQNILAGVTVNVVDDGRLIGHAVTDENGAAEFRLPKMTVTVHASKEGYLQAEKTILIEKSTTETIQLTEIGLEGFPWWIIIIILGIIGIAMYLYWREKYGSSRSKITI